MLTLKTYLGSITEHSHTGLFRLGCYQLALLITDLSSPHFRLCPTLTGPCPCTLTRKKVEKTSQISIQYQTYSAINDSGLTRVLGTLQDLFLLPGRGLFLPSTRDTSLNPSLGYALHDNSPAKPTHVHVHKHDIASRASGKRGILSSRCPIFVRDGRGDGSTACFDESYRRCFDRCEDERCGEHGASASA